MKLYTEEQVKEMIDDAHNGIDGYYDIFKKHTPIELPSDEEIEEKCNGLDGYEFDSNESAFFSGSKWIRDKIQGGIK